MNDTCNRQIVRLACCWGYFDPRKTGLFSIVQNSWNSDSGIIRRLEGVEIIAFHQCMFGLKSEEGHLLVTVCTGEVRASILSKIVAQRKRDASILSALRVTAYPADRLFAAK